MQFVFKQPLEMPPPTQTYQTHSHGSLRDYLHLVIFFFFWSESFPILKRPGVNALRNAFETEINLIAQTTSGGGLDHIPDKTGQV